MKQQLNEKQLNELIHIRDWCLTIVGFVIEKYGDSSLSLTMYKDIINDTYNVQNLRGIRCLYRDMNEWGRNLPTLEGTEELNKILYAKFGSDLDTCSGRDVQKIKRILKKGKISTENEFRLVLGRVEEIYTDDSKQEEVSILNKLLADYEKLHSA